MAILSQGRYGWDKAIAGTLRRVFLYTEEAVCLMTQSGGSIVNVRSTTADIWRINALLPGFIVRDEQQCRFQQSDNRRYRDLADSCRLLRLSLPDLQQMPSRFENHGSTILFSSRRRR
jgi:hypothetical protein